MTTAATGEKKQGQKKECEETCCGSVAVKGGSPGRISRGAAWLEGCKEVVVGALR